MVKDVLIIGGGVIGLSIARELHKQGARRITLLEKGVCGRESSWAAAGMLGPQAETDEFGPFYGMCTASRDLYPAYAADLLAETGVDVELERSGTLSLAFTEDEGKTLMRRYRLHRDHGQEVELLSQDELLRLEPYLSASVQFGLRFANDWQVENRLLMTALRKFAEINSIEVHEDTPVDRLLLENGRVAGAQTSAETFRADHTIIATGAWTSLIKLGPVDFPLEIEPIRGQMICLRHERRMFASVIYGRGGYIVPRADGRVLAGSTTENAGFEKVVTDDAADKLLKMAREISPFLEGVEIEDHWSGLRPHAVDGQPVLGPITGIADLTLATGHYRNGILLAPLTAQIVARHVSVGEPSEYFEILGPDRFIRRSAGTAN